MTRLDRYSEAGRKVIDAMTPSQRMATLVALMREKMDPLNKLIDTILAFSQTPGLPKGSTDAFESVLEESLKGIPDFQSLQTKMLEKYGTENNIVKWDKRPATEWERKNIEDYRKHQPNYCPDYMVEDWIIV